jgi:hypothetical protein
MLIFVRHPIQCGFRRPNQSRCSVFGLCGQYSFGGERFEQVVRSPFPASSFPILIVISCFYSPLSAAAAAASSAAMQTQARQTTCTCMYIFYLRLVQSIICLTFPLLLPDDLGYQYWLYGHAEKYASPITYNNGLYYGSSLLALPLLNPCL